MTLSFKHGLGVRIAFGGSLAGFFLVMCGLAGIPFNLGMFTISLLGAALIINAGEFTLKAIRGHAPRAYLPSAFVLGFGAISLAMLPLVFFLHLTANSAFVLCGVAFAGASWVWRRRGRTLVGSGHWKDVAVIFIGIVLVAWFSRHIAQALPQLESKGVLNAWNDYYVHGALIAQFGDVLATNRGDILFVDQPNVFYHYASYMVPAAIVPLTGLPGLGAATAVLLPLGLLIAFAGLYALGSEISGRATGFVAVLAIALLPDGSHYFLQNGFFGFHWLLFTAPGTGYAIGLSGAAFSILIRWQRVGGPFRLLLSTLVVLSLLVFRAQVFALVVPAFVALIVLTCWWRYARRIIWFSTVILGTALAIVIVTPTLRDRWLGFTHLIQFLDIVHQHMPPTSYSGWNVYLVERWGRFISTLVGLILLPVAILGSVAFLYPAAQLLALRRRRWRLVDFLPVFLFVAWLALVLCSPIPSNGDITELKHRPFPLVYAVVGIWLVFHVQRFVITPRYLRRLGFWPAFAGFSTLSIVGMALLTNYDPAGSRMAWTRNFYQAPVKEDIPSVARYIRKEARQGDVLAVGDVESSPKQLFTSTQLVSLTNIPAYLAGGVQSSRGADAFGVAQKRAHNLAEAEKCSTPAAALKTLQDQGVRWYLMIGNRAPNWDSSGQFSVFRTGNVMLYDTARP